MSIRGALSVLAVSLAMLPPVGVEAQMQAPVHFETWQPSITEAARFPGIPDSAYPAANGSGMVMGGLAGWVVGWMTGAIIYNAAVCGDNSSDDCGWGGFGAAVAVGTFTIPAGVHMGNHGRGDLLKDVLVSAAMGGLGLAYGAAIDDTGIWLLLVPVGQIVGSIWMESKSMEKKGTRTED